MTAVIIAAGCGSRLESQHNGIPKTLLSIEGRRIIDVILHGLLHAGIEDVVVVTGYEAHTLENYLRNNAPEKLNIEFAGNPRWRMSNGVSVLAAEELILPDSQFVLLMSDHIFEPDMLKMLLDTQLETDEALLAIDFKTDEIPDLDDGMKVKCHRLNEGGYSIDGLSKSYRDYQAIDCGMFKLNYGFFRVLEECIEQGKDSLSDACNTYAEQGRMKGMDIGENRWIDIDTPEMFSFSSLIDKIIGGTSL